ncbi:MAG: LuxR C-terminal-related transcriptional regulator [Anaerolineales bacterium]
MSNDTKAIIKDQFLLIGANRIQVGSQQWFEWLSTAKRFSFKGQSGSFVAQGEKRRNKVYWYAYRRAGRLIKAYLGKCEELTLERLEEVSISIATLAQFQDRVDEPLVTEKFAAKSRIDTSFLPFTKVNVPVLPPQLVTRPRLTHRISTPLTLIYAPSGFGKSTLLNDWKQSCGHPVAWLSLDDADNRVLRFWQSVVMALQTIDLEFGKDLLTSLKTISSSQSLEIVSRLTNDIVSNQSSYTRISLVLDDFHRINRTEVYDAVQALIEHLPPNMQLIILGHTNPPLSLGHLRAKGLLTELDANDLRFTLEEGIDYLRQYERETPLAYDDLAKLVKHAEGWAAGLTLTALALGKQSDQRQFIDTFSGAHIYMREYFMETVLQRSNPEVQSFLLKTAILNQLTGSLCEAVTGQTGGEEMLLHLWQENVFIVRLNEQGWYRYHDLFAEMLLHQLQTRFSQEVPQLHKRAAEWYRAQYASADAIYHLLAVEAWEEAALLMEEMSLRELEQYGEDSRLLRWLQELPASAVQRHKMLLLVYLRLAHVALPRQKMDRFISRIETNLSTKPVTQQTQDEQDVLVEIQRLRHAWEHGDQFTLPVHNGNENDAKWELLNDLQVLKQANVPQVNIEPQVSDLLHRAQAQGNLFVILMAGGVLARRVFANGQLRRSEKIAHQVLDQALAQRGKLPEPASITLAVLSQIHMERNDLGLAEKYLRQALEVDPNPTSTNMLVQIAIQRTEMQIARRNFTEAIANIHSMRELHHRRPSGLWSDQDLLAYEALIYIRMGEISSAERILASSGEEHGLFQWIRAETLLLVKQAEPAERLLNTLLVHFPNGIQSVPLMRTRILLAWALFEQHKVNQALQVIKDAIRLAAPEQFIRPFLGDNAAWLPLLSLALQTENLTSEAQNFVKDVLQLSGYRDDGSQISGVEMATLSTSALISPREQEILHLISAGYTNREMAGKLSISESTVKTHVGNIYQKLQVNSRVQAITRAKELKLV